MISTRSAICARLASWSLREAVDLARLMRLVRPVWNPSPVLLLITVFALLGAVALTFWAATAPLGLPIG